MAPYRLACQWISKASSCLLDQPNLFAKLAWVIKDKNQGGYKCPRSEAGSELNPRGLPPKIQLRSRFKTGAHAATLKICQGDSKHLRTTLIFADKPNWLQTETCGLKADFRRFPDVEPPAFSGCNECGCN